MTLADTLGGAMTARDAGAYVAAQTTGGILGAIVANAMFGVPWVA